MIKRGLNLYTIESREQKRRAGKLEDPVIGLVDEILYQAVVARASDIHVHLQKSIITIKFRIDGVLLFFKEIESDFIGQLIARFKILANLDVSDIRQPQDGKCTISLNVSDGEKIIDLRFATIPSVDGEKLLIRILDMRHQLLALESLGLSLGQESFLRQLVQLPYGLVLVTGPTGSGKSTTLYGLLSAINSNERQIVTLEDPVEYSCNGIVQVQVNAKFGFTFDQGLRAMLRQDPDVMMIGEIRDKETAQICMEAALTGHLVFSTLHTKDALGSIVRLKEMGIKEYLLNATLTAIVAQRILRKLCQFCKIIDFPSSQERTFFHKFGKEINSLSRPKGCNACFNTGYFGRTGIFEILVLNDSLREGISKNISQADFFVLAKAQGYEPLLIDGLDKVISGLIAFEELLRVIE